MPHGKRLFAPQDTANPNRSQGRILNRQSTYIGVGPASTSSTGSCELSSTPTLFDPDSHYASIYTPTTDEAIAPMAPPTRFNSVRGGSRPVALKSFRDDSNLVGFRYDKAVAAEPPVHIAPRHASSSSSSTVSNASMRPKGLSRSPSSSTTTSSSSYSHAASISVVSLAGTAATSIHGVAASSGGPVIVAPPRLSLPVLAPPTEQHPALRSPAPSSFDDWKRDSAAVVTKTIPEEERLNVAKPSDDDDCFVEKRPASKDNASGAASHIEHIVPAPAPHAANSASARAHRQSLSSTRPTASKGPATAAIVGYSRVSGSTGTKYSGRPSKNSTNAPVTPTNSCAEAAATTATAVAGALTRPGLAALDLRIASSSCFSSSSSSSYTHPAPAITASDFLPAPISPPPSPSRSSPRRKISKRRSLRFSLWGGSREVDNTAVQRQQYQHPHQPAPVALRRWNSVSQLRGGSTGAGTSTGSTGIPVIPGSRCASSSSASLVGANTATRVPCAELLPIVASHAIVFS
ncbi:hypothetical protein PWT90_09418 [Aphanocladium album]|nr:hypothetical protein PWT90_09418 [Aphanocladium album]